MGFWTLVLIAVGLSADAFAVALGKGLHLRQPDHRQVLSIAITFGFFQAVMPLVGWLLGNSFADLIAGFDHWIAFGLLALLGVRMVWQALSAGEDTAEDEEELRVGELLVLGVATSIDALAVGISLSFLPVNIWWAIGLIGGITFAVSAVGVVLGKRVGIRLGMPAEVAGGVILVLIGFRILLDHLGVW